MNIKFQFWALAATGSGISGGDRIFIEFARRWSAKYPVAVYTSSAGAAMCRKLNLSSLPVELHPVNLGWWDKCGFFVQYFAKIFTAVYLAVKMPGPADYIYSASEFWMDSLPALILKIRFPQLKWIAAWYQTAPDPLRGFSAGRYRASALVYWLFQLPIKPLIDDYADYVLINNDSETNNFPKLNSRSRALVVLGAVNTQAVSAYLADHSHAPLRYSAVFQGRFHPQKGVVELIDIWKLVTEKQPHAKLAMIGDGPLMPAVRRRIAELHLQSNIDLLGYVFDGEAKYAVFAASRLVVHPSLYDSGGMASAEAMAFGLPGVGYDLESYRSYYPHGLVKVPLGDKPAFAAAVVNLLNHPSQRQRIGAEAQAMINKDWSWDTRAGQVLSWII